MATSTNDLVIATLQRHFFNKIFDSIKNDNRYILDNDLLNQITNYFENNGALLSLKLEKGTELYRTRLIPFYKYDFPSFHKSEMLSPPAHLSKGGRMNPAGISYLYTSDDDKTAISELRPWVGAKLCMAKLAIKYDLVIFNSLPCDKLDNDSAIFLQCINELFSTPVHSDDIVSYSPSQYIAELIKKHKYNGILYKSSLSDTGNNIALFNSAAVEVIDLYDICITKAEYKYDNKIAETELYEMTMKIFEENKNK